MLLLHDAYFYWTHRLMHWKVIFKHVHKLHHEFTNPTPFTSYAFHPLEGLVQIGILFVIVFTIPHHSSAVSIFFGYALIINLNGHTGYEFSPRWYMKHRALKWINTSLHHNLHHQNVKSNYGFYFNFWDTIMNTTHKKHTEHFEAIADRRAKAKSFDNCIVEKISTQDTF